METGDREDVEDRGPKRPDGPLPVGISFGDPPVDTDETGPWAGREWSRWSRTLTWVLYSNVGPVL